MKIQLTFKNPECVWDGLKRAGIDPNDPPQEVDDALDRWITYGEYVTIEVDTETGNASVIPA